MDRRLILLNFFFFALFQASNVSALQDIIMTPVKDSPIEKLVVYIQGAFVPIDDYVLPNKYLQNQSSFKLWIGIPDFPFDSPNPIQVQDAISTMITEVQKQGANIDPQADVIVAAHSLGGVFSPSAAAALNVSGMILHASYLGMNGSLAEKYTLYDYPIPVFTLGGEVDGLTRVTRLAFELQKFDAIEKQMGSDYSLRNKPVVVIPGIDHSQYCQGVNVTTGSTHDLVPDVTWPVAHQRIAEFTSAFLDLQWNPDEAAQSDALSLLSNGVDWTRSLVYPFLDAFALEQNGTWCASTQTELPNLSDDQRAALTVVDATSTDVTSFSFTKPSVASDGQGGAAASTDSYGYYVANPLDISTNPVAAQDFYCKTKNQQAVLQALGLPPGNGTDLHCRDINAQALRLAESTVLQTTLQRFLSVGKQINLLNDTSDSTGSGWLSSSVTFKANADGGVDVSSPALYTDINFPLVGGMHYCNLASPARIIEWMMVDSLPTLQ